MICRGEFALPTCPVPAIRWWWRFGRCRLCGRWWWITTWSSPVYGSTIFRPIIRRRHHPRSIP